MKYTTELLASLIDGYETRIVDVLNFSDADWELYWTTLTADSQTFMSLNRLIYKPLSFEAYTEGPMTWICEVEEAIVNVDKEVDTETWLLLLSTLVPFINERNEPQPYIEESIKDIPNPKQKQAKKSKPLADLKQTETYKQFLYNAPHTIFRSVAVAVNQLCGLSKTSSMVAHLFTTLPMQIELRHITDQPKPSKKLNALEEFVHAYIKHDDVTKVYIAFFYDSEKHIKRITKAIDKHPEFFAYLYMREALKITRRMNTQTHYKMMSGIIKHNNPSIPVTEHYRCSIAACNYAVNETIKQLFVASPLKLKFNTIIEGQSYNNKYTSLSEMDILVDLLKSTTVSDMIPLDELFSYDKSTNQIIGSSDYMLLTDEATQTDMGETLENHLGNMSRGGAAAAIFAQFFTAKKVSTGWFKKLSAKFNTDVYQRTNQFRSEWSNLNIIYRNKFKSPNTKYTDNKLSIILSIDHSGSVSTDGLQKLLYLIEKQGKRIAKLFIMIHDTEIVREFQLSSNTDISNDSEFKEALAHRFAVGGTSHYAVFQRIDELIRTKKVDPEQAITIIFSDMQSDIPSSIKQFPRVKQLQPTFLSPDPTALQVAGCTTITMS